MKGRHLHCLLHKCGLPSVRHGSVSVKVSLNLGVVFVHVISESCFLSEPLQSLRLLVCHNLWCFQLSCRLSRKFLLLIFKCEVVTVQICMT